MNNIFKKLAIQASNNGNTEHFTDIPMWYLEKFAELIVQECAEIAKHNVTHFSTYGDAEFVKDQIKQHFGVEK